MPRGKVQKIDGTRFEIRYNDATGKPDAIDVYAVPPEQIVKVSPAAIADIKKYAAEKAFQETGKTKKTVLPQKT